MNQSADVIEQFSFPYLKMFLVPRFSTIFKNTCNNELMMNTRKYLKNMKIEMDCCLNLHLFQMSCIFITLLRSVISGFILIVLYSSL